MAKLKIMLFLVLLGVAYLVSNQLYNISALSTEGPKPLVVEKYKLALQLPPTTVPLEDEAGKSHELLANYFLSDLTLKYRGYLQIWEISDLNVYLDNAKSFSRFNFTSYTKSKIKQGPLNGYIIKWSAVLRNAQDISGQEVFLQRKTGNQVLRLSIFSNQATFPDQLQRTITSIQNSIKWE